MEKNIFHSFISFIFKYTQKIFLQIYTKLFLNNLFPFSFFSKFILKSPPYY